MKTRLVVLTAFACMSFAPAWSATLRVTPSEVVLLPSAQGDPNRIVVRFDLSGLREGEGRKIMDATMDWKASGIPKEEMSSYFLFPVTSAWSRNGLSEGGNVEIGGQPTDRWELEPVELERISTPRIRFDMTGLVTDWVSGASPNYGTVIEASSLDRNTIEEEASKITLTIRYAFGER